MKMTRTHLLFWTPRILAIVFALFISMFALDVFNEGHGFWQTALALGMHLVPTAILFAILALAWRWEWIGAIVFSGLGVAYIWSAWGRLHWSAYAVIAGPLFVMGILFLINWVYRAQFRSGASRADN